MTEIEILERAKKYVDSLANGKNPLNGENVPDGEVINNVRISRCLFYVSEVLQKVINNGGEVSPAPTVKAPSGSKEDFSLSSEQLSRYSFSDRPVTVSEITEQLNSLKDEACKKIAATHITSWLVEAGFLEIYEKDGGKKAKCHTRAGVDLGISMITKTGQYGAYDVLLYSKDAQQFILDNLDAIVAYAKEAKAARKAQRALETAKATVAAAQSQGYKMPSSMPQIPNLPYVGKDSRMWTQEEDFRIITDYRMGKPAEETASELDRTPAEITSRLKALRILND